MPSLHLSVPQLPFPTNPSLAPPRRWISATVSLSSKSHDAGTIPTPLTCPLALQSRRASFTLGRTTREALHGRPPHSVTLLGSELRRATADPPLHHRSPTSTHPRIFALW